MKSDEKTRIWWWKLFALLFLPTAVISIVVSTAFYYQNYNNHIEVIKAGQLRLLDNSLGFFRNTYTETVKDLLLLANNPIILEAKGGALKNTLIEEFRIFSDNRSDYSQVRFIDQHGNERIRINKKGNAASVVPDNQLQNKSHRYYFEKTMQLKKSYVYSSPIDLNIEENKVEEPYNPVLRFGTPIFDENEEKAGMVILNFSIGDALEKLKKKATNNIGQLLMTNSDGFFILGRKPEEEWGFMFSDKQDQTMNHFFPLVWKQIVDQKEGFVANENGWFIFITLVGTEHFDDEKFLLAYPSVKLLSDRFDRKMIFYTSPLEIKHMRWLKIKEALMVTFLWLTILIVIIAIITTARLERHIAKKSIEESYQKLLAVDMAKAEFMSMVTHELRSPLGLMKGYLRILLKDEAGPLTDGQKEFLGIVVVHTERLLNLVNDLLDTAKIEAGMFSIHKNKEDVVKIVETCIRDMKSVFDDKQLEVKKELVEKHINASVDVYRITQALINLMGNSIKFSPFKSTITIGVYQKKRTELTIPNKIDSQLSAKQFVWIFVSDQGEGIEKEKLDKVFERFSQLKTKHAKKGTGLGLSITKNIVESHDGAIWVESEGANKGSTFHILLPIE